ncbi:MAG: 2,3-epoxybenzoyl-CoA dihydrolase [Gammaproteobacteria bacterium]|nr:2,3-epoxybenzoyl-CoA dihydrolase [Gammaproteobacteria bacterium]
MSETETIDFHIQPDTYRHWSLVLDENVAYLSMDVDEQGGLFDGYELKLNSYDLGVDIELADIVQRLRFEHPEIGAVVLRSAKERVFCAGANIRMLGGASHAHKVNFCKFTNETRNALENAGQESGQHYIAAVRGACAGGGYELALACDEIYLADDGSSSVALPEVPLLAVLPGTGGLTRVTDKRKVRRDLADVFCSMEEGVRGKRASQWGLVDEVVTNSKLDQAVTDRARTLAEKNHTDDTPAGISLTPLQRRIDADGSLQYSSLTVDIDREKRQAILTLSGPDTDAPGSADDLYALGADSWMLRLARELDDAILHLRFNELELGLWVFKTVGDPALTLSHENALIQQADHWLAREILLYWKRVLKRIDLTSRSLVALIEHGSCFSGVLAEILFAVDRTYMMKDEFEDDTRPLASITLSDSAFGRFPMSNGLSRLQTRFLGDVDRVDALKAHSGQPLLAAEAEALGLVTFAYDDIDWEDEIRIFLEERASFSADALTGMEANLRFPGPETMETRIFGRLTAWQNWIFQRPNAVGENGALQRYGSGTRAEFDPHRV